MPKNARKAKIKTPVFEYSWYKEVNKIETNKKLIQNQIDSFKLLIDNKESVKMVDLRDELKEFIRIIPSQGHLVKLDKEYQDKFFEITKFVKEYFKLVGKTFEI